MLDEATIEKLGAGPRADLDKAIANAGEQVARVAALARLIGAASVRGYEDTACANFDFHSDTSDALCLIAALLDNEAATIMQLAAGEDDSE